VATRTGVAKIDDLIEQFGRTPHNWGPDGPLETISTRDLLADPAVAKNQCDAVAKRFDGWLSLHGVQAGPRRKHELHKPAVFTPVRDLGYNHLQNPDYQHRVTFTEHEGVEFFVDWTAAQLGIRELPHVRRLSPAGEWEPTWD
jgi:hypothetical protein